MFLQRLHRLALNGPFVLATRLHHLLEEAVRFLGRTVEEAPCAEAIRLHGLAGRMQLLPIRRSGAEVRDAFLLGVFFDLLDAVVGPAGLAQRGTLLLPASFPLAALGGQFALRLVFLARLLHRVDLGAQFGKGALERRGCVHFGDGGIRTGLLHQRKKLRPHGRVRQHFVEKGGDVPVREKFGLFDLGHGALLRALRRRVDDGQFRRHGLCRERRLAPADLLFFHVHADDLRVTGRNGFGRVLKNVRHRIDSCLGLRMRQTVTLRRKGADHRAGGQ